MGDIMTCDEVEDLVRAVIRAIIHELDKYGAAVAGHNTGLRERIAASHRDCIKAAVVAAASAPEAHKH